VNVESLGDKQLPAEGRKFATVRSIILPSIPAYTRLYPPIPPYIPSLFTTSFPAAYTHLYPPIPIYTHLHHLIYPHCSPRRLLLPIPTYTHLYPPIPTYTTLYTLIVHHVVSCCLYLKEYKSRRRSVCGTQFMTASSHLLPLPLLSTRDATAL
jgi:hypothetical protein